MGIRGALQQIRRRTKGSAREWRQARHAEGRLLIVTMATCPSSGTGDVARMPGHRLPNKCNSLSRSAGGPLGCKLPPHALAPCSRPLVRSAKSVVDFATLVLHIESAAARSGICTPTSDQYCPVKIDLQKLNSRCWAARAPCWQRASTCWFPPANFLTRNKILGKYKPCVPLVYLLEFVYKYLNAQHTWRNSHFRK